MRLIDLVNGMTVYLYGNDIEKWEKICKDAKKGKVPTITLRGIEYALVRHGKWKIKAINTFELSYGTTGYEPVYQCSECGGVEESYLRLDEPIMPEDADFPKYCPHCGARMEEVNND